MARTIRTKVFKFDELSEEAKQKAIAWYKDLMQEGGEGLEGFTEFCVEECGEAGFKDAEIQYSFSYSQGDGLSFSATVHPEDLVELALPNCGKLLKSVMNNYCIAEVKGNNGRYTFASKGDVDFYLQASKHYPNIEAKVKEVCEFLEDKYMELCGRLEKDGYKWLEGSYEDEAISDNILANDYEFTKAGERFVC